MSEKIPTVEKYPEPREGEDTRAWAKRVGLHLFDQAAYELGTAQLQTASKLAVRVSPRCENRCAIRGIAIAYDPAPEADLHTRGIRTTSDRVTAAEIDDRDPRRRRPRPAAARAGPHHARPVRDTCAIRSGP
jgi:hypothetical protein